MLTLNDALEFKVIVVCLCLLSLPPITTKVFLLLFDCFFLVFVHDIKVSYGVYNISIDPLSTFYLIFFSIQIKYIKGFFNVFFLFLSIVFCSLNAKHTICKVSSSSGMLVKP